ncbi:hypothetical protein F1188_01835 [Roseospira marina]|uniref:Xcc1710-like domain-containing protein n=1 Tax=Roseospira marina TaxID=140057 RepID=A0A5M6IGV4_9PROT|nr:Mth938-like domain-containing protein [Roseospira marina]KAA5607530.1 hypothetical protein F1188_01835 [Roseospira marina]MBB4312285.1 uncharacterized protein [Roseospira marina]MBB5085699.1 uncharacterized protein [Roseospira marina]
MDISPIVPRHRQVVQAYGDGAFRISGVQHAGSVIVMPETVHAWSGEVSEQGLAVILDAAETIDILLVGGGPSMAPIPAALRQTLRAHGIVPEPMDTGAGCRTYNVLMAEDRHVAAALVAV